MNKTRTILTYGLMEFSFLWHGIFVGKCLPDGCILLFCRHCYLCWLSTDFVATSLCSCSLSCWLVGVCMWDWRIVCHFGCLHPGLCHLWYRHEWIDLREWSWAAAIWNTQFVLVNFCLDTDPAVLPCMCKCCSRYEGFPCDCTSPDDYSETYSPHSIQMLMYISNCNSGMKEEE